MQTKTPWTLVALAASVLTLANPLAHAAAVNVDFQGASATTYVGTGVAPDLGTTWNAVNPNATNQTLVNSEGNSSGVTLTLVGDEGVWGVAGAADNVTRDYIFGWAGNTNPSTTVNLSGLPANTAFDLHFYAKGDNANQNPMITLAAANGGASGTTNATGGPFSMALNHVLLSGNTDASGNIIFTFSHIGTNQYWAANGFQLVYTTGPDTTAPTITSFSPADNAPAVAVGANLVATFNEPIAIGTGDITIKNLSDSTQSVITLPNAQVTVSGSILTINPTTDLLLGKNYAIKIEPTAIKDLANNPFTGIINDTTWNFAVQANGIPFTDGLVVSLSADAVDPLDTTNQVRLNGADIFVKRWNDQSGNARDATQTTQGDQPRYIPNGLNGLPVLRFAQRDDDNGSRLFLGDLGSTTPSAASIYIVSRIDDDARYNLFGNRANDDRWVADTWNESKPGSWQNGRNESNFAFSSWPTTGAHVFVMNASTSGFGISINGSSIGSASGNNYNSGSGANWTIGNRATSGQQLKGDIAEVLIYNRVLTPIEENQVGAYLTQKYGLVTNYGPPVISSLSPADNDASVHTDSLFVATFNKAIARGSGNITIKNLTDSTQTNISVTDTTQVLISGSVMTINPTTDLLGGKNYAIQIAPTAIDSFSGITDDTTWNFTTASLFPYESWTFSGSLFILTTPDGANIASGPAETNFPLLLRFNSGNFPFNQAAADGRDIRFTTATGMALSYQIEEWDSVNGRAAVWVKIPSIAANARQEIKMHWGKAGVASQSNGSSVFNSSNGCASVHHLGDTLADAVGTTSPTNSGTTATNGLIGKARTFASGQGVQCGTAITGLPTGSGPFSTSVWIRTSTFGKVVLGWGVQDAGQKVVMNLASPPSINMDCFFGGGSINGSAAIPSSDWSHVVHTFQTSSTRLYVNGLLDTSTGGGGMGIPTTSRLDIGGFIPTDGYSFVGEMDEVRISNVARSANWVKLEYENQKPVQTLVGSLVPSGSNFSVSPTSVTMNEVATTTLTAQAGGAQKVYWINKKGAQETILATDQLTFNYTAPRISANDSATIQFKAVFAGGTQTIDVPLTVIDTVPDPVFTLVPSTTSWDGRSTMTVTANVSNLAAMQAAGVGTLNYKWSVNGVAVTKQTSDGTLTLTRSQGSGPMTVSLTIDNGGATVSQSIVINVQEPASDPWIERTPSATEKPVNGQFFARNPTTGLGTIFYNGTQIGSPNTVFLKVYRTPNGGAETLETTHRQALVGGAYAFTAPIAAGLNTYRVVYGTTTSGVDTNVATVSDLVCGDAFIIEGQSNALATDNSAPDDTTTTNKWVRSYSLSSGWGYAVSKGNDLQLGLWGWYLANRLVTNHSMPICIINGAAGGTRIDMHMPNPANHALPLGSGWSEDIYANLYNRVVGAKLTHGIRGLLWHQGEQDQGAIGPDGDYNYKFYQQYFVDISAAWKQDFPNLRNYYLFQIWPAACGETSRNDQLREAQRTLPYLYSNMKIMSTHGIVPGSGCHYEPAGYQVFSDLIGPLVEQDVYGLNPTDKLTAPNLQRAYFTTPAKTEITLVFDQNVNWNINAPTMLFLANASGATSGNVTSGSATGNTIKLQVSGATNATTITYLKGLFPWEQADILKGANGIAALTFADVPIDKLTAFDIWAGGTFANAFTDKDPSHDPDFDGMTNREEFAFGLDPTNGASANPISQPLDKANRIFKYTRTKNSGLTYKVYYSTNLSAWNFDAAATQSPTPTLSGIETVTVTLAAAADLDGKLFVRVEATPTP